MDKLAEMTKMSRAINDFALNPRAFQLVAREHGVNYQALKWELMKMGIADRAPRMKRSGRPRNPSMPFLKTRLEALVRELGRRPLLAQLNISKSTFYEWKSGTSFPNAEAQARIVELEQSTHKVGA